MTLPLWGQLQKSQDDPETIEEAINRLIDEHNNDPESHLDEGESLSQHKQDDVIDHPAFSVVPDKFEPITNITNSWVTEFLSPANFTTSGDGVATPVFKATRIRSNGQQNDTFNLSILDVLFDEGEEFFNLSDFTCNFDFWTRLFPFNQASYFFGVNVSGHGFANPGDGANGVGFNLASDGKLYAVWQAIGDSLSSSEITGVNTFETHKYSIRFTPGESIIFMVDDVTVFTATTDLPAIFEVDNVFAASVKKNHATPGSLGIADQVLYHLLLWREPLP